MSQQIIEKLLKGAEVEWKTLEEIFTLKNGYTPSKSVEEYWIRGTVPWFRMEDLRASGRILNNSVQKVHIKGVKGKLFPKNSIIMATTATIGEHALITVEHLCNQQFTNFVIKKEYQERLNIKFAYYYFFIIDQKAKDNISISSFPSVQMTKLKKWMFPIPPLSVQKEIVGILDAFTAHTAELTAELNERKKQYNYYRDKLLTFSDEEVEWKTLGDIGEVRMCKRILKHQTSENGDVPFYKIGTFGKRPDAYISRELFNDYKKKYNYPKIGEVLISASGTIGRTVIFDGSDAYFQDSNIVWIENDESQVLNKYLFYYYKIAKWGASEGGTIARLYNDNLRKVAIPIPTLAEQQRIVDILDKFDALTTSITQGLPREIELRQKQYEYYRDQLLNFPKPENDAIKHNSTNR